MMHLAFSNMYSGEITFKELTQDDLPLLYIWLNKPHVQGTYAKTFVSKDDVVEKYGKKIRKDSKTKAFIFLCEGRPAGYIQTYRVSDYPDYESLISLPYKSAGVDLFIGDENFLGKGLGSTIIKKFTEEVVLKLYDVEYCVAGPDEKNIPSIKAFEKAGYRHVKTIRNLEENINEYLVVFRKIKA